MADVSKVQTHVDPGYVSPAEWRWAILLSLFLGLLASLPYLWLITADTTPSGNQFMGILYNPQDGATYLSKIRIGQEGNWRTLFRHTPDPHSGFFLQIFYPLLGHASRLIGLSEGVIFHMARIFASVLMYLSIYNLGAIVWKRLRPRRIFFLLCVIGSGFGWLLGPLTEDERFIDLTTPEAFPMYSALVNPHFPFTLTLLCLIAGTLIMAFRPGMKDGPTLGNGGLMLFLSSFGTALLYPHALVPITLAVAGVILIDWLTKRRVRFRDVRWISMLILPAAPIAAYYIAELRYNPAVVIWSTQNVTLTPGVHLLLGGLGLPLLIALPGIYRAVRKFEPDGDQLMLLWLVATFVLIYMPFNTQRRFIVGLMIPITYFAVRALQDTWFKFIRRRLQGYVMAFVYILSGLTYGFLLLLGVFTATTLADRLVFLDTDYVQALNWVDGRQPSDVTVLGAYEVSLWMPSVAGVRPVYGHPFETLYAESREAQVAAWYDADDPNASICSVLLDQYDLEYVLVGPLERELGPVVCAEQLTEVERFGEVQVYAP